MRYRKITMGGSISRACPDPILSHGTVPVWVWISWINGSITIGSGNVTGMNPVLYYPDNSMIVNVSTVAVSSYGSITAVWKIPYIQSTGNRFKINDLPLIFIVVYFLAVTRITKSSEQSCRHAVGGLSNVHVVINTLLVFVPR